MIKINLLNNLKRCSKCQKLKSYNDFGSNKARPPDYLNNYCKACIEIRNANPEWKKYQNKWTKEIRSKNPLDKEKKRVYGLKNRATLRIYHNKYNKIRRKTDVNYKLAMNLRGRLWSTIRKSKKMGSAVKDLGCTLENLKAYLEAKFEIGMTWDNYGFGNNKWNIDHIKPLSSFDLTDRVQFLKACHYSNLQPLWQIDNLRKSDKYEPIK